MLCGVGVLLGGTLLGCGHDPNRGIEAEQAKAAANRVHKPPSAEEVAKMGPGFGG